MNQCKRYVRLSEAGDPLEKLNAVVPREVFRKPLMSAEAYKIMVLQALYRLSDGQAEIHDRHRSCGPLAGTWRQRAG